MTRHIIDTPKSASPRRVPEFLRIDRRRASQPNQGRTFRQMHNLGGQKRMLAFLKIARGYRV